MQDEGGKGSSGEVEKPVDDTNLARRRKRRERSKLRGGPSGSRDPPPLGSRGKEKHDRQEEVEHASDTATEEKPAQAKGKERAYDTSGEVQVRGKERELRAAREAQMRNEPARDNEERERDKKRIRMLEEEIARLRAQVVITPLLL